MRALSASAVREMLAQESGEVFLVLLTMTHADMTTLRVVNNTQDIVSGGDTYVAFPFDLNLPQDMAEELGTAKLTISNVDRRIVDSIREISSPIQVALSIIAASAPNVVEVGPLLFDMVSVDYDADRITGTLAYEPVLNEPFPAGTFNPQLFPGLFGKVS